MTHFIMKNGIRKLVVITIIFIIQISLLLHFKGGSFTKEWQDRAFKKVAEIFHEDIVVNEDNLIKDVLEDENIDENALRF